MTAEDVTQRSGGTPTDVKATVLDIHGYRVGRTVGQGSYATVREAYSQRHKCRVAIKIITKKKAPDNYLEKFLPREIDVVKILKHPNLVVFLQSIETNNRVYLIMEYAPGGDLLEAIKQQKVIPEKQTGIWFGQMVDGLDYCHEHGVVHRDLKCENILLDEFQNLKITDFGFARCGMKPTPGGPFLLSDTYCGSYAYAPPEILTGTPYVPQSADIWSMGVILYVMIVGRLPFDDSNHRTLLKQVKRGPTFPEKRQVSPDCKDILVKILVKEENRPTLAVVRSHSWFQSACQPVLDMMQKEVIKHSYPRTPSVINANHNNANTGIHPDACVKSTIHANARVKSAIHANAQTKSTIHANTRAQSVHADTEATHVIAADGDADSTCDDDDATVLNARRAVYKMSPIRESSTCVARDDTQIISCEEITSNKNAMISCNKNVMISCNKNVMISCNNNAMITSNKDAMISCNKDVMISCNKDVMITSNKDVMISCKDVTGSNTITGSDDISIPSRISADTDDDEAIVQNDIINNAIINGNMYERTHGMQSAVKCTSKNNSRNAKDSDATRTDVKHYLYKVLPPIQRLSRQNNVMNNTSEAQSTTHSVCH